MIGEGSTVLFSHQQDLTPACTTELTYMANIHQLFVQSQQVSVYKPGNPL